MSTKKAMKRFNFPKNYTPMLTVKEMLEYIKNNNIPMDAEVVVEHVNDHYLERGGWSYYVVNDEDQELLIPIHNGLGSVDQKRYFVLWMHY